MAPSKGSSDFPSRSEAEARYPCTKSPANREASEYRLVQQDDEVFRPVYEEDAKTGGLGKLKPVLHSRKKEAKELNPVNPCKTSGWQRLENPRHLENPVKIIDSVLGSPIQIATPVAPAYLGPVQPPARRCNEYPSDQTRPPVHYPRPPAYQPHPPAILDQRKSVHRRRHSLTRSPPTIQSNGLSEQRSRSLAVCDSERSSIRLPAISDATRPSPEIETHKYFLDDQDEGSVSPIKVQRTVSHMHLNARPSAPVSGKRLQPAPPPQPSKSPHQRACRRKPASTKLIDCNDFVVDEFSPKITLSKHVRSGSRRKDASTKQKWSPRMYSSSESLLDNTPACYRPYKARVSAESLSASRRSYGSNVSTSPRSSISASSTIPSKCALREAERPATATNGKLSKVMGQETSLSPRAGRSLTNISGCRWKICKSIHSSLSSTTTASLERIPSNSSPSKSATETQSSYETRSATPCSTRSAEHKDASWSTSGASLKQRSSSSISSRVSPPALTRPESGGKYAQCFSPADDDYSDCTFEACSSSSSLASDTNLNTVNSDMIRLPQIPADECYIISPCSTPHFDFDQYTSTSLLDEGICEEFAFLADEARNGRKSGAIDVTGDESVSKASKHNSEHDNSSQSTEYHEKSNAPLSPVDEQLINQEFENADGGENADNTNEKYFEFMKLYVDSEDLRKYLRINKTNVPSTLGYLDVLPTITETVDGE